MNRSGAWRSVALVFLLLSSFLALPPLGVPIAAAATSNSLVLTWTATGDDGDVGRASAYELRYSTTAVGANVAGWWAAATPAAGMPQPNTSGSPESFTVSGLQPQTHYYFILRVVDEVGNVSGFSNTADASTLAGPPPPPPPPPSPTPSASPTAFHAYPNPSSGPVDFEWSVAGTAPRHVSIRLYDMNGHWIATIAEGDYDPGTTRVTWDRSSRAGEPVSPGYYEALGTIGDERVRERVILLP